MNRAQETLVILDLATHYVKSYLSGKDFVVHFPNFEPDLRMILC